MWNKCQSIALLLEAGWFILLLGRSWWWWLGGVIRQFICGFWGVILTLTVSGQAVPLVSLTHQFIGQHQTIPASRGPYHSTTMWSNMSLMILVGTLKWYTTSHCGCSTVCSGRARRSAERVSSADEGRLSPRKCLLDMYNMLLCKKSWKMLSLSKYHFP